MLWGAGFSAHYCFLFNPQTNLTVDNDDYLQLIWTNMMPDLILSVVHGALELSVFGVKWRHDLFHKGKQHYISSLKQLA